MKQLLTVICLLFALQISAQDKTKTPQWLGILTLTEKYKDENYFQKHINEAGGSINAHTTQEITSYYFDVMNDYFDKSLDI